MSRDNVLVIIACVAAMIALSAGSRQPTTLQLRGEVTGNTVPPPEPVKRQPRTFLDILMERRV